MEVGPGGELDLVVVGQSRSIKMEVGPRTLLFRRMDAVCKSGVTATATATATRCAAHALLFTFTLLLVRTLDHPISGAWWHVFCPLWLFHAIAARWRFSIPAPYDLHGCHRPPFHTRVATQLLVAFELLLCIYLETSSVVNLKIVFLPVVVLEIIIIMDNIRMCFSLILEEMGDPSVNVTWEKITHCLIILSMAFILGATLFMVLMLTGDMTTGNWWGPYFVFSVGQCLAFLVCTKWTFPAIDRYSQTSVCSLSSRTADHLNQTSCLAANIEEDQKLGRMCSLQNIGGLFMKVLIIAFQALLFMYLQGTPARVRKIPFPVIFSPLLLLQGVGFLFSTLQLVERIVILLFNIEAVNVQYFMFSSRVHDFLEFMLHGSRLLGWWSIDEVSREAEERLQYNHESGCYTFSDNSLDVLKKMSKSELVDEVWTLKVALNDQIKTAMSKKRKYEQLRNCKVLCRKCTRNEIDALLRPCGHWVLCRSCCKNRKVCPVCRSNLRKPLLVYDT